MNRTEHEISGGRTMWLYSFCVREERYLEALEARKNGDEERVAALIRENVGLESILIQFEDDETRA